MKRHIPNLLTSMNILSGCIACVMAFEGNFLWVVVWIIIAAICDFFDGFSARLLNALSPIGKDLDSLADMVSFGLAPSIMVFKYLNLNPTLLGTPYFNLTISEYIPYVAFLLAVCSGLRLAKFNVDERQTTSFIGLPTPANALFWISFCYSLSQHSESVQRWSFYPMLILIVIFSILLPSELPMFSLKVNNMKWKGNELRYILIVYIIVAVLLWGLLGISTGIILYIILSVIVSLISTKKGSQTRC